MGSSGGYSKKNTLTGTEKKLKKAFGKEFYRGEKYRKKGEEAFAGMLKKGGLEHLERFLSKSKDPYADLQSLFGAGGKAYSEADFAKDIRQGQKLAKPILEGERRQALSQFDQSTVPGLYGAYGRGTGGSSAFNQALASARTNLEENLFNRSQELGLGLGSDIAARNQAERARQQGMQYSALQDILGFQGQAAQQYYGTRAGAANQLLAAGVPGGQTALQTPGTAFVPRSTPFAQTAALAAIEGGAKVGGAYAGAA